MRNYNDFNEDVQYRFYYHDNKVFAHAIENGSIYFLAAFDLDGKRLKSDNYNTFSYQAIGTMTLKEALLEVKNNRKHYGNYLFDYRKGGRIQKYVSEIYKYTRIEWTEYDGFSGYENVNKVDYDEFVFNYDLNGNLLDKQTTHIVGQYTTIGYFNTIEEALNKVNEMGIEYYEKLEDERIERMYEDTEESRIPF